MAKSEEQLERERREALMAKDVAELGFVGDDYDARAGVFLKKYNEAILDGYKPDEAHAFTRMKTGIDPERRALDVVGHVTKAFAEWLQAHGGDMLPDEPDKMTLEGAFWIDLFGGEQARSAATACASYWNRGDFVQAARELQRAIRINVTPTPATTDLGIGEAP